MYYVYILYSESFDKFYIGQTNDLANRVKRHNAGSELYTKRYIPWILKWSTQKPTRAEAMVLEKKLKNLSKKRLLIFMEKYSAGPDES